MATIDDQIDVVVIGGGPAGCAAALAARQRGLRPCVIERDSPPAPAACPGWVSPRALAQCSGLGVDAAALGTPFRGARLRSWDFKHCVEVSEPDLTGAIVAPPALGDALLHAVSAAGIPVHRPACATDLHLGETAAAVRLSGGATVTGQIVLLADGAASPCAERANLAAARAIAHAETCAAATIPGPAPVPGLEIVLGGGGGLRIAAIAGGPREIRIVLTTRDESAPATTQLAELLAAARAVGVLPARGDASPLPAHCLAGTALEMESHISKRCLLIGDAGGFVAAFSNESLYPALRSGELAAEAALRALRAPVLQDELAGFSALWRADLADYLRMPNTDLSLLLPMVFNNAQMSRRVVRAFLLGLTF